MGEGYFFFKLGAIDCAVLNVGASDNPIDSIFSNVPQEQLVRALRKESHSTQNARLDTNVMLLRSAEQRILVDSGWGEGDSLVKHLQLAETNPEDINIIILTHSDSDHTAGLVNEAGKLLFPNASYIMARKAWEYWNSKSFLNALASDRAKFINKLQRLIMGKIQLVEPEDELMLGVIIIDNPGHRKGHIALQISSEGENLLHIADGILHPIFFSHPTWQCAIDTDPDRAVETRDKLLSRATENDMLIAGSHLPFPGIGRAKSENGRWVWRAVNQES